MRNVSVWRGHYLNIFEGRIGIVDHDTVDVSNLQRQVLHTEGGVGAYKADSAAEFVKR